MDLNNSSVILKSKIQVKSKNDENDFIEDVLEPVKTEYGQTISDLNPIIDSYLIPEVKTEIIDFDKEYNLPHTIGEKRKNNEKTEIEPKKIKEEFVVFEECDDDQPITKLTGEKTHDKVFNYQFENMEQE